MSSLVKRSLWSIGVVAVCSLAASCQSVSELTSSSSLGSRTQPEDQEQTVVLQVSGRLERGEFEETDTGAIDFRTSVQLNDKATLPLVGLDHRSIVQGRDVTNTTEDPLDLGSGDRLVIELSPASFGSESVALNFQVLKVNKKSGAKTLLSGPKVIVEYGSLAEIREVNTSPDAPISRLSLTVLPQRLPVSGGSGVDATSPGQ